jgi:hypothetical protein
VPPLPAASACTAWPSDGHAVNGTDCLLCIGEHVVQMHAAHCNETSFVSFCKVAAEASAVPAPESPPASLKSDDRGARQPPPPAVMTNQTGGFKSCIGNKWHELRYSVVAPAAEKFVDLDSSAWKKRVSNIVCDVDHTRLTMKFHSGADATAWLVRFHDLASHCPGPPGALKRP